MCRVAPLLVLLAATGSARAELSRVWAVDDGTKVSSAQLDHPLADGNLTFDGRSIRLVAARNEIVSFQVITEGGGRPTAGVSIRFDGLGPIRNGDVSDDPDRYYVDRYIETWAEHYVPIAERSHDLYWTRTAMPRIGSGELPDALLPIPERGITVPARTNRAFWIDVYVTRSIAAGTYRGAVNVQSCEGPGCRLDVELEVIDAVLPDRPTAKTMLWFSGSDADRESVLARYKDDPEAVRRRHFFLARRNRITLFIGKDDAPTDELEARLTGRAFTAASGYAGPGAGVPQDLYVLHTYGDRVLSPGEAGRWSAWLADVAPEADALFYVWDEPSESDFDEINRRARLAAPIASFVTAPFDSRLDADVFASLPSAYVPPGAGKRAFVYNGVRPFSGSYVIDDVAISPRVNPWIQYARGIERWFYWEATYYVDFQGGRGSIDVFARADNFQNRSGDVGNGDGLLMYPGGATGRPMPSIRLHNWRRGIQDVEYLALARAAGHSQWVDQLLDAMIPRSLDRASPEADVSWSEDGERWLEARRLLATALSTGKPPPIPAHLIPRRGDDAGWLAAFLLLAIGILSSICLLATSKRL